MKLRFRFALFVLGALTTLYGLNMMHRGVLAYKSWFRGINYSPGTVATGLFISLLAFLPPASLVDRLITRKKSRDRRLQQRHRHHSN